MWCTSAKVARACGCRPRTRPSRPCPQPSPKPRHTSPALRTHQHQRRCGASSSGRHLHPWAPAAPAAVGAPAAVASLRPVVAAGGPVQLGAGHHQPRCPQLRVHVRAQVGSMTTGCQPVMLIHDTSHSIVIDTGQLGRTQSCSIWGGHVPGMGVGTLKFNCI